MSANAAALIVFAKAPETAKRRLAAEIGRPAATRIATALIADTLVRGRETALAPRYLYWDGSPTHPSLTQARALDYTTERQTGSDLGARMAHAFAEVLGANEAALLIGTDCPDLDAGALTRAAAALTEHDAVLVPAHDGGYVLVGLRQCARPRLRDIFEGIGWGGAEVAEATRRRFAMIGLRLVELPPLEDLDRQNDFERLARRHPFLHGAARPQGEKISRM